MNEWVYNETITRRQLSSLTQLLRYDLCEEAGEFYSTILLNRYTRIPRYGNTKKRNL